MSETPVEHEWLALCHAERDHVAWLTDHRSETESEEFRKRLRDWWGSIERLLAFHEKELAESGVSRRNIPIRLLSTLRCFAGYLAVGQIPSPIADTATEGRRKIGPSYRRDVGFAVAYILAAKQGIQHQGETIAIADKAPVKTVCEAFDVKRTAVRNWQRTVPVAYLGANRVNAEIVTSLMKSAAERYRIAGRSERAIERRGRTQLG
jgi:hypothetical protein